MGKKKEEKSANDTAHAEGGRKHLDPECAESQLKNTLAVLPILITQTRPNGSEVFL
jgi:hypothetical protein